MLEVLPVAPPQPVAPPPDDDADAEDDAAAARTELAQTQADLVTTQEDLNRVEAGAALYASQITGVQEPLVELEPQVSAGVDEAIEGLRTFSESTLSFDVNIDEVIPVQTDIVIDRVVEVPIKTTIPIRPLVLLIMVQYTFVAV